MITSSFACVDIHRIIACAVMCDPLETLWEAIYQLLVEYANLPCRVILSVYTHDAIILPPRATSFKE